MLPVTWMYCGLFSAGKLKAEAENLSWTKPNLINREGWSRFTAAGYKSCEHFEYFVSLPVKNSLLEELHPVPICLWFEPWAREVWKVFTPCFYGKLHIQLQEDSFWISVEVCVFTLKQVVVGVFEEALDVEGDEELSTQWISVQIRGQSERHLQHRYQQETAGRCLPVPALHLPGHHHTHFIALEHTHNPQVMIERKENHNRLLWAWPVLVFQVLIRKC